MSEMAYDATVHYFESQGYEVVLFQNQHRPYEAVGHHPDMFMFYDGQLYLEKDIDFQGIKGEAIGRQYPETIKYNVAQVGRYLIGYKEHVAQCILKHGEEKHYEWLNVKQGYAKCNVAVVGEGIITSDKGIYDVCRHKVQSLLIQKGYIELPGLDSGFIGGCCVAYKDKVFFNGDITKHPDYQKIKTFVESFGYTIDYVNKPLMDIGSFMVIERRI